MAPASHEQSFPQKGGKGEAQLLAETRVTMSLPNRPSDQRPVAST